MIVAIVGPTGVGKTRLSIELAKKYDAIVINCDAMQVYKEMNIGTAKIKEEEKNGVPHFLFDISDVEKNYTVYDYQKDARKLLDEFKNRNIIFVGGSGLYLKAALYNYVFHDEDENNEYENKTNDELYDLVLEKDPNTKIHKNNRKRMVRFLNKKNIVDEECYPMYDFKIIGLTTERDILYERINARVDAMFKKGLLEEAKEFYDKGIFSKALNTAIGYKELYQYFEGKINLEEAKELIQKNSRHYAKRQYTWLRHQLPVTWLNVNFENFNETIEKAIDILENQEK